MLCVSAVMFAAQVFVSVFCGVVLLLFYVAVSVSVLEMIQGSLYTSPPPPPTPYCAQSSVILATANALYKHCIVIMFLL